jgi:hypothetical protein
MDTGSVEVDEATADELVSRIDRANIGRLSGLLRESYSTVRGIKEYHATLARYDAPDGSERFAVVSDDPSNAEYTDSADQAEADAAYETLVRSLADCAGPWEAWWEHTDVDGVPVRETDDESED